MAVTEEQMKSLSNLIAEIDSYDSYKYKLMAKLGLHVKQLQLEVVKLNERNEELHRELARTRGDILRSSTKLTT